MKPVVQFLVGLLILIVVGVMFDPMMREVFCMSGRC